MNKKTQNEKKSCVVSFRVTRDEKQKLETLIRLLNTYKSSLLRDYCSQIINHLNNIS
jgi:hypothetical protein